MNGSLLVTSMSTGIRANMVSMQANIYIKVLSHRQQTMGQTL